MTTQKSRAQLQEELRSQGYAWDILSNWQPKVDLYWHVDQRNQDGDTVKPRGALVKNMPGNPDSLARYSRRGLLAFPPTDTCRCKGCREARVETPETLAPAVSVEPLPEHKVVGDGLCACGFKSEAPKRPSRKNAVYRHIRTTAQTAGAAA